MYYSVVTWASLCLKSLTTWLFVTQPEESKKNTTLLALCEGNPQWPLFTKEVNQQLAKCPLFFNGHLANHRLTSLVTEATGDQCIWFLSQRNTESVSMSWHHYVPKMDWLNTSHWPVYSVHYMRRYITVSRLHKQPGWSITWHANPHQYVLPPPTTVPYHCACTH